MAIQRKMLSVTAFNVSNGVKICQIKKLHRIYQKRPNKESPMFKKLTNKKMYQDQLSGSVVLGK